jgi:ParB-like chromosome segregation protein Spo0J
MCPTDLELRVLPVSQLTPAPYNPRRPITQDSPIYRKLATSLREFGLVEPLVWNEATGHVVGGHLRLRILKDMGVCDVPVSVVRLSPEREKALNIVLNNREVQGRFDPAALRNVLEELAELPELELTGFDQADLKALHLEPTDNWQAFPASDMVEITLEIPREKFDQVQPAVDRLVQQFDLVGHLRGL